jgi:hypothetical protein
MCADSDLQVDRPKLALSDIRPGASGVTVRVKVIQHLCHLETADAGKIVEWLVADEGASCVLKTTLPVADRLHLGIWYDLLGAQVDLVAGDFMRLVIGEPTFALIVNPLSLVARLCHAFCLRDIQD